jgi:hypothetical protein
VFLLSAWEWSAQRLGLTAVVVASLCWPSVEDGEDKTQNAGSFPVVK